ncbi:MAG: UDP-N-acetylglucosamine 1-carboxyvinyltransferase [Lachnospiraceae bacterium]|nr:UDP-N-acetylglucosamine 1-carboxyvinyltransferase [Lachnospiraceae bacterium]MBQ9341053.1 UDP-N-acetylglucosamine 1-carboxyvinyltransferase [Lachnospiraceae bacterium]
MENDNRHIFVKGGKRLQGEVTIEGSKNSALVCMAASALADKDTTVTLNNVPDISDVYVMIDLLRALGKTVTYENEVFKITGELKYTELPRELCGSIRGSTYFLGVMMAGLNHAYLGLPGGDRIGARPIDIHLDNLEMMGMKYKMDGGVVEGTAPNGLSGRDLFLSFPSVGATCNIIMAASRAKGKTTISNCAKEPEIVDLANLLSQMGVKIIGAGSDKITIYGSAPIKTDVEHDVISDRIETGVFITAVAITGGDAVIKNCTPYHNYPLISMLSKAGVFIEANDNEIHVVSTGDVNALKITTMPFPGVATDLQPLLTVLALKADGISTITDLVFPERFSYIYELAKMGAKLEHSGNTVRITGVKRIDGTKVVGSDIRAATALVCAGLMADGVTEVEGMHHIERGYKDFVGKLKSLGAEIMIK